MVVRVRTVRMHGSAGEMEAQECTAVLVRWKLKDARQYWWDGSSRMHGGVGEIEA